MKLFKGEGWFKPDLIVGNTLLKDSPHSFWHGCYCAYLFVIVVVDKMQLNTNKQKTKLKKKGENKTKLGEITKMRTPNVWLYFNMIIQG